MAFISTSKQLCACLKTGYIVCIYAYIMCISVKWSANEVAIAYAGYVSA